MVVKLFFVVHIYIKPEKRDGHTTVHLGAKVIKGPIVSVSE